MRNSAAHLAACLLALGAAVARAATPQLLVTDAWLRATPGTDVAAVYLTLHNTGAQPLVLVAVRSPLAQSAMVHETQLVGTQSTMRAHEQLTLPPGQTIRFAPGGLHVMLHGLQHPLAVGEVVPLVLLLQDGGALEVTAQVRPLTQE